MLCREGRNKAGKADGLGPKPQHLVLKAIGISSVKETVAPWGDSLEPGLAGASRIMNVELRRPEGPSSQFTQLAEEEMEVQGSEIMQANKYLREALNSDFHESRTLEVGRDPVRGLFGNPGWPHGGISDKNWLPIG